MIRLSASTPPSNRYPASLITHHFAFDRVLDAYENLANAGSIRALAIEA